MNEINSIIKDLEDFNWAFYNGPEYYRYNNIIPTIKRLIKLNNEEINNSTYHDILSTIGNNHAGTYYPVTEKVISYLIGIALKSKKEVSRNCSLEILTDLYFFSPELGDYNKLTPLELEKIIKKNIREMKNDLISLVNNKHESERNVLLAKELIEDIKEDQ